MLLQNLTVAMTAALLGAGVALAQTQPPRPTIINPDWVARPSPEEMWRFMPKAALAAGKGGSVDLMCTVTVTGLMKDCIVVKETPAGLDFGVSALSMSSYFQLRPRMADGKAEESAVIIPIRWECPGCNPSSARGMRTTPLYSNVRWLAAPTYADWAKVYPPKAKEVGASGAVSMRCKFDEVGGVKNCAIQTEAPKGMGFGRAALSLARHFRGPTTNAQGASTKDSLVNLQVAFSSDAMEQGRPRGSAQLVQGVPVEVLAQAYPKEAAAENIKTGRAVVACNIDDGGAVSACRVQAETPAGKGFGQAALSIAPKLRYSLWSEDGQPVNRTIALPIAFDFAPPGEETSQALLVRAERALSAGRMDEAMVEVTALMRRYSADEEVMKSARPLIGRITAVAQRTGEHARLLPYYDVLVETMKDDAEAWNSRCWFKATRGVQLETAVADCDRAIALEPTNANALDSRGFAHLKQGDFTKALADYEASLKLRPDDAYSLFGRGVTKLRLGDRTGGNADIAAAVRKNQGIGQAFEEFGIKR